MASKERLQELIKDQYGSYEKLGKEIGITTQGVSEIVNGRTTSATARYSVAKALGVDVADLWPETAAPAA